MWTTTKSKIHPGHLHFPTANRSRTFLDLVTSITTDMTCLDGEIPRVNFVIRCVSLIEVGCWISFTSQGSLIGVWRRVYGFRGIMLEL